jgi:hypothetical protein
MYRKKEERKMPVERVTYLQMGKDIGKKNCLSSTLISTYSVKNKYCKVVEVVELLQSYTTTQSH